MVEIKATCEQVCESRAELANRYFGGFTTVYGKGNMGIVALLSDLQEEINMSDIRSKDHYRRILNDIKCILIKDNKRKENTPKPPEKEVSYYNPEV